jgi:hypothetical protein
MYTLPADAVLLANSVLFIIGVFPLLFGMGESVEIGKGG